MFWEASREVNCRAVLTFAGGDVLAESIVVLHTFADVLDIN